jgi:hypothetical protein
MILGINNIFSIPNVLNFVENKTRGFVEFIVIKSLTIYSNIAINLRYINRHVTDPIYLGYVKPFIDILQLNRCEEIVLVEDGGITESYYDLSQYNEYGHTLQKDDYMVIIKRIVDNIEYGNVFYSTKDIQTNYIKSFKIVDYTFLLITLVILKDDTRFTINLKDSINFYIENNELLNFKFLEWYMLTKFNYVLQLDEYAIKIIDHSANTISLNSTQSIKLFINSYMIINKNETKKI